ncbi:MAG: DUF4836 family protein [Phocaeicola sp.]
MKKNLFRIRHALLVVLVTLFASCESEKKNHATVIPADAILVSSIDLKSIATKSGMGEKSTQAQIEKLKEEMAKGVSNQASALIKQLFDNPSTSGIDFSKKSYLFMQLEDSPLNSKGDITLASPPNLGAVLPIKNSNEVTKMLTTLGTELGSAAPSKSESDYWEMKFDQNFSIMYNDYALLILAKQNGTAAQIGAKLMIQESEMSICKNPTFQTLETKNSDLAFILNLEAIPAEQIQQMYGENSPLAPGCELKDLGIVCELNFEKGKIVATSETLPHSEAWKNALKKAEKVSNKMDKKFLEFIPADALFVAGMNFNGKVYKEEYQSLMNSLTQSLMLMGDLGKTYTEMIESLTYVQGNAVIYVKVKGMLDISGEAFVEGDEAEMNALLLNIPNEKGVEKGRKENYSYISYNVNPAGEKKTANSFAESEAGATFNRAHSGMFLNITEINKLAPLLMGNRMDPTTKIGLDFLQTLDYTVLTQHSYTKAAWEIVLNNKTDNALKVYVDMLSKNLAAM